MFVITGPSLNYQYPIRDNMWLWVQYAILYLLVSCFVIVLFHCLDQCLLILILFLGCCRKLSVGRIQTVHMDFLIPHS